LVTKKKKTIPFIKNRSTRNNSKKKTNIKKSKTPGTNISLIKKASSTWQKKTEGGKPINSHYRQTQTPSKRGGKKDLSRGRCRKSLL